MRLRTLAPLVGALVLPAPALADVTSVAAGAVDPTLVAGDPAVVRGSVLPAAADVPVVLERRGADGAWTRVGVRRTDAAGAFRFRWRPARGGTFRVRAGDATAATSAELPLAVGVRLVLPQPVRLVAFSGGEVTARVRPASYRGRATLVIRQGDRVLARRAVDVRDGRLAATLPMPRYGDFRLRVVLTRDGDLAGADEERRGTAAARPLAPGATGSDVRVLVRRLADLRIFTPEPTSSFDERVTDSVITFQKAYGLDRTGVVDATTWRRILAAQPLKAAHRRPATHIEVDIDRQILIKVIDGEVARILPVSTGATGNTPRGTFQVLRKDSATTSLFGGLLYNVLTYHGNFAIHGYPFVPPYPASHGCTRVPGWIAPWLWEQSTPGETVYNL